MNTVNSIHTLESFAHLLQLQLHSQIHNTENISIHCVMKDEALLILAQHSTDIVPDGEQIFKLLEQVVRTEKPSFSSNITIYLRLEGEKRPYAFHKFALISDIIDQSPVSEFTPQEDDIQINDHEDVNTINSSNSSEDIQTETTTDQEEEMVNDDDDMLENPPKKSHKLILFVAVAGLGAIFFFGSLYALSKPCVIGTCNTIKEAEKLNKKTLLILQQKTSVNDILQAKKQLEDGINMLGSIPFWSNSYKDAQELLKVYQGQLGRLNQVITALTKANLAGQKAQNPPHTMAEWQAIKKIWLECISALDKVPRSSEFYPLAQQKQRAYKINLSSIEQRLKNEQQANKNLQAAKEAAQKAAARQGVANSLESWQLVYASWQIAVMRLGEIAPSTSAYKEAQQLLKDYQEKLISGRDRTTKEQFGTNAYKQSIILAQRAKSYQVGNQWSLAVSNWRTALNYVKQIPQGTFYHPKSQQLISAYSQALKIAEKQLQLASMGQQARSDLTFTCAGRPQICNFAISNSVIKVRLTQSYMQAVQNTAMTAKVKGDVNTQSNVYNHVSALGDALKAISENARIRLEVYTPDGVLRQVHNPGQG